MTRLFRWAFGAYLVTCSIWSLAEWADCLFTLWLDSEGYRRFEIAALVTIFTTMSILGWCRLGDL